MSTPANNRMMTVEEFAELVGLSAYTVREKARNREFKFAKKVGNQWRFVRAAALKFAGVGSEVAA